MGGGKGGKRGGREGEEMEEDWEEEWEEEVEEEEEGVKRVNLKELREILDFFGEKVGGWEGVDVLLGRVVRVLMERERDGERE